MSTHKKFEEATLQPGKAIPLTKEEIQGIYGVLDILRGVIDLIRPEAMPSVLTRQEASDYKLHLIDSAKLLGMSWGEDDCGVLHSPFIVSRADKKKCLLCDREIKPKFYGPTSERMPLGRAK